MWLRPVSPIRNIQGQTIFPGKKPGFTRLRLQQTFYSAGHEQIHRVSSVDPVNIDGFILFPGDPNQFMGKCRSDHIDTGKIKFHFFGELYIVYQFVGLVSGTEQFPIGAGQVYWNPHNGFFFRK